jgi:cytochrome c oxidase subunit 2
MAACAALFIVAPFVAGGHWWLPKGVSTHAGEIDTLFYIILYITGFFFILTEALLVYFMYLYAGQPGKPGHVFGHHADAEKVYWTSYFKHLFRPVSAVIHNQHRLELAWTIVPAVILLFIAFVQVKAWADVKYQSRMPQFDGKQQPLQLEISARQFEWRMRYPDPARLKMWQENKGDKDTEKNFKAFARNPYYKDIHVVNQLHLWKGQPVLIQLTTLDVIHSFNNPHMRIKQDALPGKWIPVWFTPTHANTHKVTHKDGTYRWEDGYNPETGQDKDKSQIWEIACAELCGWGHYRMVGRIYVHEDERDFLEWLRDAEARQNAHEEPTKTKSAAP